MEDQAKYEVKYKVKPVINERLTDIIDNLKASAVEFKNLSKEEQVLIVKSAYEQDFQAMENLLKVLIQSYKGDVDLLKKDR